MSTLDPSTAAFTPLARRSPVPASLPALETGWQASGPSVKRKQPTPSEKKAALELEDLLARESAGTKLRRLATHGKAPVFNPVCSFTTLSACPDRGTCTKTHFEPLIRPYTDPSLGHCSYLNLCYGDPLFARNPSLGGPAPAPASDGPASTPATGAGPLVGSTSTSNPSQGLGSGPGRPGPGKECRYLHFHVQAAKAYHVQVPPEGDRLPEGLRRMILSEEGRRCLLSDADADKEAEAMQVKVAEEEESPRQGQVGMSPVKRRRKRQWINCDLRSFDYSVLGQFQVIMADPPWDIHMSLPYGTMTDDELRRLPIPSLQPDWGILALWVTGRAMELGRELISQWGYRRVDELVWVKVNQLGRLIRTGRTGHWLNHTCEHLLIALKLPASFPRDAPIPWSDPALKELRRSVDTDVIVSEVRETSRKPDEIYSILDRLSDGRKLELFGRKHNTREGWLTLGNQLGDSSVSERDVWERMKERYPGQEVRFDDAD